MLKRGVVSMAIAAVACSAVAQQLKAVTYAAGFSSPMEMVQDPSQSGTQYVVERAGRIRVFQNGSIRSNDFLNITSLTTTASERGLLGLALAPDYASSGNAYIYYTDTNGDVQIKRYTRSAGDPFSLDPTTVHNVITIPHPNFGNHNGGSIQFGPDGFLYAGVGDGGSENDPSNNAQNPNLLLGKMIRIDPAHDDFAADPNKNYAIPSTNPFANGGGPVTALGEIWAFGYRNPFRFSFDDPAHGGNGGLIVGDVGQDQFEEVDYEPTLKGGRNYGWRQREGAHSSGLGGASAYTPLTDPVFEYAHNGQGKAIIGGRVYRGAALGAGFQGRYFFGDEVAGKVWSIGLTYDANGEATASGLIDHSADLGSAIGTPVSFDTDSNGELYMVNLTGGTISRIEAVPEPGSIAFLGMSLIALMRKKAHKRL